MSVTLRAQIIQLPSRRHPVSPALNVSHLHSAATGLATLRAKRSIQFVRKNLDMHKCASFPTGQKQMYRCQKGARGFRPAVAPSIQTLEDHTLRSLRSPDLGSQRRLRPWRSLPRSGRAQQREPLVSASAGEAACSSGQPHSDRRNCHSSSRSSPPFCDSLSRLFFVGISQ